MPTTTTERPLCADTKKDGTPCQNRAKAGEAKCASHLGTAKRRSKLTPQVQKSIVESLELGNTREGAAAYAGISHATFYRWMETGEADIEHDVSSKERDFREAVTRAEGVAEQSLVAEVRRSAVGFVNPTTRKREGKDWRAAAWLLERRYKDRWSQQIEAKHSGSLRTDPPEIPDDRERMEEVGGILADIGVVGGEG